MKKKLLSIVLALTLLSVSGCGGSTSGSASGKWVDSSIKGTLTAESQVSEKDDFIAAVNKDLYVSGQLNDSSLNNIARKVTERKRDIIENESISGKGMEEVRKYVRLAEDWDTRNALGLDPLVPYIKDIESISSTEELYKWIVDTKRNPLGTAPMDCTGMDRSEVDEDAYCISLGKSRLTLKSEDNYFKLDSGNLESMVATEEKVTYVLTGMGYDKDSIKKILDENYQFEKILAGIKKDLSKVDEVDKSFTLEELEYMQGDYPLVKYLENWGYDGCKLFITDSDHVKLLDVLSSLYLDEIKAMCIVEYVVKGGSYLDKATMDAFKEIDKPRGEKEEPEMRTEYQQSEDLIINEYLGATPLVGAINEAYVDQYIDPESYERLYNMTLDLVGAVRTIFSNEKWLSEEGKQACCDKLDAIKIHVVYPSETDYSTLDIATSDQGGNLLEAKFALDRFSAEKSAEMIAAGVDRDYWDPYNSMLSTTITNAYYNPSTNGIYILAGILDEPAYFKDMSYEELLGGIGMVVGHEITHGFDANGVKYNKTGMEKSWLPDADKQSFSDRTANVALFYTTLTPFESSGQYNGTRVQEEATADMGGIKACLELASRQSNFDYDRFFRHLAKTWASQVTLEREKYLFNVDTHPLAFLRVNVALSQFDEFHNTYGAKEGDGMYVDPENRIAVW